MAWLNLLIHGTSVKFWYPGRMESRDQVKPEALKSDFAGYTLVSFMLGSFSCFCSRNELSPKIFCLKR